MTDETSDDTAAREAALARFDEGLERLAAKERQRQAWRRLWLAHHWPDAYDPRCVTVAGRPVCRRCLALHPLALVVAVASAAGLAPWPTAVDPWPIWLLSIPATVAYVGEAVGFLRYRPRWQTGTTLLAALAFGRGLGYELTDRWHPWFWGPLVVFGGLWLWATMFAGARRGIERDARRSVAADTSATATADAQSAATASTNSSSLL
ncbi:MAG: hypothetical protein AAGD35_17055 [Actinomycetota bacterium]